MPLDVTAEQTRQQILDLVEGFTVETTPGSAAKIPDYREHLRPGARVAVTFLPGSDFADTVATAKRLQEEGFQPMPHFAARSIPSRQALEDYLKALADVTELRRSGEHTSELQSLMRISYAVFCLKKQTTAT